MRRDELFHVVPRAHLTPFCFPPLPHWQRNRIIRRTFPSSSFFLVSFFIAIFSLLSPLNFSSLSSSLLRVCANARNLYQDWSRVDTDPTRYSLATLFFLTFPCTQPRYDDNDNDDNDDDGKMRCRFSSCHVLARNDRMLSLRIYVARHDSRELSAMKFANGTIPFRFIHFSYRHHKQYILQNTASFPNIRIMPTIFS